LRGGSASGHSAFSHCAHIHGESMPISSLSSTRGSPFTTLPSTTWNASERLVRDGSLILKDGTDEIIRDVVDGKLSVSAAASSIRAQRTERQTAAALYLSHRRSSSSDAWLTPKWLIDRAVACLGGIDGDVAAEEERGVPARWWLTAQDDALTTPSWSNPDGSPAAVWMNPPYNSSGKGPGQWTRRVVAEWEAGRVRSALLLLPARPGAKWQQELSRFPRLEFEGHLTFEPGNGNPARDGWTIGKRAEAPFASLLIGVGVSASELHHHFGDVGVVYVAFGHIGAERSLRSWT